MGRLGAGSALNRRRGGERALNTKSPPLTAGSLGRKKNSLAKTRTDAHLIFPDFRASGAYCTASQDDKSGLGLGREGGCKFGYR